MSAEELVVVRGGTAPKFGDRIHRARTEWEAYERAFGQSVALLCGIIESESSRFPDEKLNRVEAELSDSVFQHRAAGRADFARLLQEAVNEKNVELVAAWRRDLGIPAAAHVRDLILRFSNYTDEIIDRIIPPELHVVETEDASLLLGVDPRQQLPPVSVSWFRKRTLHRVAWQLKATVAVSVNRCGRKLIERIQERASAVREQLLRKLDAALESAMQCALANPATNSECRACLPPPFKASQQIDIKGAVLVSFESLKSGERIVAGHRQIGGKTGY